MTMTVLGFDVVRIAWRDTHDCLIAGLPVPCSLHLPRIEAKAVEEGEVCWGRIERRQDHRMMEVLVTVQSKRRVRQPLAATFEDVIRHVFVAHPSEFDIGEGLGDALHNSILHGHAIGEVLSRKFFDQSSSVAYRIVSRCPLPCFVYRSPLVIALCGRNCTPAADQS